jgi:hypothetical protein
MDTKCGIWARSVGEARGEGLQPSLLQGPRPPGRLQDEGARGPCSGGRGRASAGARACGEAHEGRRGGFADWTRGCFVEGRTGSPQFSPPVFVEGGTETIATRNALR